MPFLIVMALGLGLSLSAHPASAADVQGMAADRLAALNGVPYVHVIKIGASRHKVPINAVVLTEPSSGAQTYDGRTRVLVISGQHGNEPTPVRANLGLIDLFASGGMGPKFLDRFVVAAIPVVNPDGFAARRRCNAVGADLNRDWTSPTQPETLAVAGFIARFRPEVVIDLHEWTADDPITPNCIEAPGFGDQAADKLSRLLARQAVASQSPQALQLKPVLYTSEADSRLAHRSFRARGMCAFLVETASGPPNEYRIQAYTGFVLSVLSGLSKRQTGEAATCLAALKKKSGTGGEIACMIAPPKREARTEKSGFGGMWSALAAGAVFLLTAASSRKKSDAGSPVSARKQSLTDIVVSDLPVRTRVGMVRRYRTRPTDRI